MATRCYLFELGFTVVKDEGGLWYRRDREKHEWVEEPEWMGRYFDTQYGVIQITYDEKTEEIVSRERIGGFWSIDDEKLLEFERGGA